MPHSPAASGRKASFVRSAPRLTAVARPSLVRTLGRTLPILILDRRPYLLAAWRIGEALAIWECACPRKITKIGETGHPARRLPRRHLPLPWPSWRSGSCSSIATVFRRCWGGVAGIFRPARNMHSTPSACTGFGRDRSWRLHVCADAARSAATASTPCPTAFRTRRAGGFRGATACGMPRARGEAMETLVGPMSRKALDKTGCERPTA